MDYSVRSVNTEQRRAQFRAYYHRNKEARRAYAVEHQRGVRAARRLTETPEQAEERKRKIREWHAKKRGSEPLPDVRAMAEQQRHGFISLVLGMLAQRRRDRLAVRRAWQHKRYGTSDRKPALPKPIKVKRVPMTIEERRAKYAEYARRWRARQPKRIRIKAAPKPPKIPRPPKPEKAPTPKRIPLTQDEIREHRLASAKRWLAKMEANDPVRYAAYKKCQSQRAVEYKRSTPQRHFAAVLRTKVYAAIRRQQGGKKSANTVTLMGCTIADAMLHIEKQFQHGMTWANFGKGSGFWNIDHIRPLASFNLTVVEQQREAFHFSNLAPRWSLENISKGSRWNGRLWKHTDHGACVPAAPA